MKRWFLALILVATTAKAETFFSPRALAKLGQGYDAAGQRLTRVTCVTGNTLDTEQPYTRVYFSQPLVAADFIQAMAQGLALPKAEVALQGGIWFDALVAQQSEILTLYYLIDVSAGRLQLLNPQRLSNEIDCGNSFVSSLDLSGKLIFAIRVQAPNQEVMEAFLADTNLRNASLYELSDHLERASSVWQSMISLGIKVTQMGGNQADFQQAMAIGDPSANLDQCSLLHIDICERVIERFLKYATGTHGFRESVLKADRQNASGFFFQATLWPQQAWPGITAAVTARDAIADRYLFAKRQAQMAQTTLNLILSEAQRIDLVAVMPDLERNVATSLRALRQCQMQLDQCQSNWQNLQLQWRDMSDALLRKRMTFADYCEFPTPTPRIQVQLDALFAESGSVDCKTNMNYFAHAVSINLAGHALTSLEVLYGLTMPQLNTLDVSRNQLTHLDDLATLSRVPELIVHDNLLTKTSSFNHVPHLRWLDIRRNRLTAWMQVPTTLRGVRAEENPWTDVATVAQTLAAVPTAVLTADAACAHERRWLREHDQMSSALFEELTAINFIPTGDPARQDWRACQVAFRDIPLHW